MRTQHVSLITLLLIGGCTSNMKKNPVDCVFRGPCATSVPREDHMVDQTQIHAISTLHFKAQMFGVSPRTVAWFPDLAIAIRCVTENWGDIFETTYTYAVIETLTSGLYPTVTAERWFEWVPEHDGGYKPCAKPKEVDGITNFSIG